MKKILWEEVPKRTAEPNFDNLLKILQKKAPSRPTLFEFFMNEPLYNQLSPDFDASFDDPLIACRKVINAFYQLGYDYAVLGIPDYSFSAVANIFHTHADIENFPWPDPDSANYAFLDQLSEYVPDGMKLVIPGGGLLENVVNLAGLEGICFMIKDDRKLAEDIFGQIGSRMVRFYQLIAQHESVGATISNDDWGFKTHTFFRDDDMRHFVFSWHKKIVEVVHSAGKPTILHSCGHFQSIIGDIVDDMKYDGRHSYEDNIIPVEEAYERYHDRIAILGGIDIDFLCRSTPEEVYGRSKAMLERSSIRGSYALGTGNSVPEYLPQENYFALIRAALDEW